MHTILKKSISHLYPNVSRVQESVVLVEYDARNVDQQLPLWLTSPSLSASWLTCTWSRHKRIYGLRRKALLSYKSGEIVFKAFVQVWYYYWWKMAKRKFPWKHMCQNSALGITQIAEETIRSQWVYFLPLSLINYKIIVLIGFIFPWL